MAITKELVFAAADALAEQGQKPTMANVRKELGGKGSFTTIHEMLAEWKSAKATKAAPVHEPIPQVINEKLAEFGCNIWAIAAEMANSRLTAEREAFDALRQETEAAREEATQLADQVNSELEIAVARITALEADETAFRDKLNESQNNLIVTRVRAENAESRVSELRLELDRANAEREKAIEAASRAREEAATLRGRIETFESVMAKEQSKQKR